MSDLHYKTKLQNSLQKYKQKSQNYKTVKSFPKNFSTAPT